MYQIKDTDSFQKVELKNYFKDFQTLHLWSDIFSLTRCKISAFVEQSAIKISCLINYERFFCDYYFAVVEMHTADRQCRHNSIQS